MPFLYEQTVSDKQGQARLARATNRHQKATARRAYRQHTCQSFDVSARGSAAIVAGE